MTRREWIGFLACGALVLALGGCTKRETFRYRMTVEVETPQGLRSGSSVIEIKVGDPGRGPLVLPEAGTTAKVRGEAVAVDLPGGKVLFALLSKPGFTTGAAEFPYEALRPSRYSGEYGLIKRTREMEDMQEVGVLPKSAYPMLVTFGDLTDPESAEEVDMQDLAASFGEGVKLKHITVQMTDEPVTTGIEKRLGWMPRYRAQYFDGTSTISEDLTTDDLRAHLTAGIFSTEFAR